jgi:hypothetical protein
MSGGRAMHARSMELKLQATTHQLVCVHGYLALPGPSAHLPPSLKATPLFASYFRFKRESKRARSLMHLREPDQTSTHLSSRSGCLSFSPECCSR